MTEKQDTAKLAEVLRIKIASNAERIRAAMLADGSIYGPACLAPLAVAPEMSPRQRVEMMLNECWNFAAAMILKRNEIPRPEQAIKEALNNGLEDLAAAALLLLSLNNAMQEIESQREKRGKNNETAPF